MSALLEDLRAEYPGLFKAASQLRPLPIARMPLWAVAIAALGVRTITFQLLAGAFGLLAFTHVFVFRSFEATTVTSYALGALLAVGSARVRGLAVAAGVFVLVWLEQFAIGWLGSVVFCERSGPGAPAWVCDPATVIANGLWPIAAGVALTLLMRRTVRPADEGISALAVAMGAGFLLQAAVRLLLIPFFGLTPEGVAAATMVNWLSLAYFASAIAVGAIAGWWGRRHVVDALLIAASALLLWIPPFVNWLGLRPRETGIVLQPAGYAVLAVGALAAAALVKRARATHT